MNFRFLGSLTFSRVEFFQKSRFKASKFVKMAVFDLLNTTKIDFTENQKARKVANFTQSEVSIVKNAQLGCLGLYFDYKKSYPLKAPISKSNRHNVKVFILNDFTSQLLACY